MWFQLQIDNCHRDDADKASDMLEESGAVSITLTDRHDDPILEPELGTMPLWPEIVIHALYTEQDLAKLAMQDLAARHPSWQVRLDTLADQDWERAWMDDFKPQRFGKRLWICPSWCTPPDPEAVNLILDPGLAFGTGTHPTTHLCLQWLDGANLTGKTMIDFGCGSGILALAALKLGAQKVHAVDIDPQALQATRNNADTNHIHSEQLHISMPGDLHQPADILIANILLTPLISLGESFHTLIKPGGFLVVSGLLSEQTQTLTDAYRGSFHLVDSQQLDDWSLLVFSR